MEGGRVGGQVTGGVLPLGLQPAGQFLVAEPDRLDVVHVQVAPCGQRHDERVRHGFQLVRRHRGFVRVHVEGGLLEPARDLPHVEPGQRTLLAVPADQSGACLLVPRLATGRSGRAREAVNRLPAPAPVSDGAATDGYVTITSLTTGATDPSAHARRTASAVVPAGARSVVAEPVRGPSGCHSPAMRSWT